MQIFFLVLIAAIVLALLTISLRGKKTNTRQRITKQQPSGFNSNATTPAPHYNPNSLMALREDFRRPEFEDAYLSDPSLNREAVLEDVCHNTVDFVVFDFETANTSKTSACAIGFAIVKNLVVTETKHFYISPQHDQWFIQRFVDLHGISWDQVYDKPFFYELWPEIEGLFLNNLVIAYNATFDLGILKETLNYYNIPVPEIKYNCALTYARNHVTGVPNYKLSSVCRHLNIPLNHHQAESDAVGAAHIMIHLVTQFKADELLNQEKNARRLNWQNQVEKVKSLKESGMFEQVHNIKKNIRYNRKKMQDNPDKPRYQELYIKYKEQYAAVMGEEYAEKKDVDLRD
jgi:DNA polymerase-3 subunit epsilon